MKRYPRSSQWQQQTKEAVLQLQAEKLRRYLRDTVVPFSPYYRELFRRHGLRADSIRSVEDLEQVVGVPLPDARCGLPDRSWLR